MEMCIIKLKFIRAEKIINDPFCNGNENETDAGDNSVYKKYLPVIRAGDVH